MNKAVGIDFGTTNSVIAVLEGSEAVVIPGAAGERLTPSVVAFPRDGAPLVGVPARNQAVLNHERTISSIKRHMGTDFTAHIDDQTYAAEDIARIILSQLKANAEAYFDAPVRDAVITVPAYFNDTQRKAVRNAGEAAGFKVLRIINEPTAAALAYGLPRAREGQILVFDLGGGTFDVSILDISGKVYEVAATRGHNMLGGDDFDARLVEHIRSHFLDATGIDLNADRMAMQKVRETAEQVKKELSAVHSANVNVPFISADANGPRHLELDITRDTFEDMIRDYTDQITSIVEDCLTDGGAAPEDIEAVVLVGGSTRIPYIQRRLERMFGADKVLRCVNPDETVAAGAAIQAGIMSGSIKELVLVDVAALSLGVETEHDVFVPVIERNSCIPTRKSRIFTTVTDNQTEVDVHILQGERPQAGKNHSLGRFVLDGIRSAPRGKPRIEVLFDIDADGIVHVSARDADTGVEQSIRITPDKKIKENELKRILEEASRHKHDDDVFVKRVTLLKQARTLLDRLRLRLGAYGNEPITPELQGLVFFLEDTLKHGDIEQLRDTIETMNEYLRETAEVG